MPLAARSPLPSSTSCSYQTTGGDPLWLPPNSTTDCEQVSDGGAVALTLCIAGPFVLVIILFLVYLLLRWVRPRLPGNGPSHSRNRDSPKPDADEIGFDGKGGDDDGSATCVSVNNPPGEVDIPSLSYYNHPHFQSNNHCDMSFLRKGLFRAASSSSSSPPPPVYEFQTTQPASQPTAAQQADNDKSEADPGINVDADTGAGNVGGTGDALNPFCTFQKSPQIPVATTRPRSFSESTITLSAGSSRPESRAASSSLPSSPSIPPPPTGMASSGTGTGNSGTLSTFSLSLSEKLERLNKQMMQKKASNSSLRGSEPESPICGSPGKTDDGDTSMDFKCRGLPDSGTFSSLTEAEAAMRVEDELATIERLALRG